MKPFALAGVDTTPLHRVDLSPCLLGWWSPQKPPHCSPWCLLRLPRLPHLDAARFRLEGRVAIVYREVINGKECKNDSTIVRFSHPLEIEAFERNVLSGL